MEKERGERKEVRKEGGYIRDERYYEGGGGGGG